MRFGLAVGGKFALISMLRRLGGCLKATIGGFGNTFLSSWSFVIVFQCFLMMLGMHGSLGWYLIARTTLLTFGLITLSSTSNLFRVLSFSKAALITFLL